MQPTFLISMKIAWSIWWRSFIILILLSISVIIATVLPFMLLPSLYPLWVTLGSVAVIVGILMVNQWVFNQLPSIHYKESEVVLMKEQKVVDKYSVLDAFCVFLSLYWRLALLQSICIIPLVVMSSLFFGSSIPTSDHMVSYSFAYSPSPEMTIPFTIALYGMLFLFGVLGYYWMLRRKKKGRWLKLNPRVIALPSETPEI